jgi:hypothetical protein
VKIKSLLKRSSPTILTCLSAVGVVVTAAMAVKATPKAVDIIRAREGIDHEGNYYGPTKLEIIQSCWKCYIPTTLVGLSTIACIFGANILNKRNQAALVSAYAFLSESYRQYKNGAIKVYGEDADSKIKVEMAKDAYVTANGLTLYSLDTDPADNILCYDLFSQRYFETTMAAVLNAEYNVNRNLCLGKDVSINEFYEFLGIEKIEHGDEIGWSYDALIEDGFMWLDFENTFSFMDDGMECCIISFIINPNKINDDIY